MSIGRNITTLPDTKQGFNTENVNAWGYLSGYLVTTKDCTIPIADAQDFDVWFQKLQDEEITPLHFIKQVEYQDEETPYQDSEQDFPYKLRDGKYRRRAKFAITLDKHKYINELSGTDLYIFEYDIHNRIKGTTDDGINLRGFKTDLISLEKRIYGTETEPEFSPLTVQLKDASEYNQRGVVIDVDWNVTDIDRLFINIEIGTVSSSLLTFKATYLGEELTDINGSDVTLTDDDNGIITASLFNYLSGYYQMTNLDKPITSGGTLEIKSSIYLGCERYLVSIIIDVTNNAIFGSGDNIIFGSGDNTIFGN